MNLQTGISPEQESHGLLAIFDEMKQPVYIADYEHLGVYACRILVPGMSDIYPAEDLLYANNNMGSHLRDTILSLPGSAWEQEDYLALFDQLDEEGFDDQTRVRELLGIAADKGTGWHTLRIGELKCLLALAAGELELAQEWAGWTLDFNSSVFTEERALFFRCLNASIELFLSEDRDAEQYRIAFNHMFGEETVRQAWGHIEGSERFLGLQAADSTLQTFKNHQKLLQAYAKLQKAKDIFNI